MLDVRDLAWFTDDQINSQDIAELHLACTDGIPGSENIDKAECIDRLNQAACKALVYTERKMTNFYGAPEVYDGSENKFRVVCMIRFLQGACGIRYNPAKIPQDAPFYLEDTFIHGALVGEGGTCASLPVVYVAVGRRMGFPLKLVSCLRHQFCRWEGGGERFNIEVNNTGIACPPDDHYREGRFQCSPEKEKARCYLISETPKMELAGFLANRGYCWDSEMNKKKAAEASLWSMSLVPENKLYEENFILALDLWKKQLQDTIPEGFPNVLIGIPTANRRFPATLPLDAERLFLIHEGKERLFQLPQMRNWCEWVRRLSGQRPSWMPPVIEVEAPIDLWRFEP